MEGAPETKWNKWRERWRQKKPEEKTGNAANAGDRNSQYPQNTTINVINKIRIY